MVDPLDWSDEQAHLLLLEAKLNAYLAFIESGEVHDRLKELGRDVSRSIPRAAEFIKHATDTFVEAGFELTTSVRE